MDRLISVLVKDSTPRSAPLVAISANRVYWVTLKAQMGAIAKAAVFEPVPEPRADPSPVPTWMPEAPWMMSGSRHAERVVPAAWVTLAMLTFFADFSSSL